MKKGRPIPAPAAFYDTCYSRENDYSLPPEQSRYYNTWKHILDKYIKDTDRILEIGCGTGQLATMLLFRGCPYVGIDFSEVAIHKARQSNPEAHLICGDIFENLSLIEKGNYNTIILLEFLEHIDNDLRVLNCIPPRKTAIIGVPKRGGYPHLRYFEDLEAAQKRYGSLLHFTDVRDQKNHIIIKSTRREKQK